MKRLVLALLAAALSACAHAPAAADAPAHEETAAEAPQLEEARQIAADVEALRGIAPKAPLDIRVLPDAKFAETLKAKLARDLRADESASEKKLWVAFGFAPTTADPAKIAEAVFEEQVAGFYDPQAKALFVAEHAPPAAAAAGPDATRWILAHELEHALQDAQFGFVDWTRLPDDDARLAQMAVYEGEATGVMAGYAARRAGKSIQAGLVDGARTARSLATDQLVQMGGYSPALLDAPAIFREGLVFPYFAGWGFIADVFHTGGFHLVDEVFAHPPTSTAEVLHPEKYVAGVQPVPVAAPAAPEGWKVATSGKLGELGARVLLAGCAGRDQANAAAEGWAGDAYAVVEGPQGELAALWSSTWEDEAAAHRFVDALKVQSKCWPKAVAGAGGVSNDFKLDVKGTTVAWERGLPEALASGAVTSLLALPGAPLPPKPPLPVKRLAPSTAPAKDAHAEHGRIADGRYESERLAVSATIPEGFSGATDLPEVDLLVRGPGTTPTLGLFTVAANDGSGHFEQDFFGGIAKSFGAQIGADKLKVAFEGKGPTKLGEANVREWSVAGAPVHIRALLVPICAGKFELTFTQVWSDDAGKKSLDAWLGSFAATGAASATPPVCAKLAAAPAK